MNFQMLAIQIFWALETQIKKNWITDQSLASNN